MRIWIARLLLRLYPRQWRARYHEEISSLVIESPLTLWALLDLARGVVDAHLHPRSFGQVEVLAPAGPGGPLRLLARLRRPPLPAETTPGDFGWGIFFGALTGCAISMSTPALEAGGAVPLLARLIDATGGPAASTVCVWVMTRRGQPFKLAALRSLCFFVGCTVGSELLQILSGH